MKQTKKEYVFMTWAFLIVGLIVNAICSTSLIRNGWNYYLFAWGSVGYILIGFGMGLATSRTFQIKGVDK